MAVTMENVLAALTPEEPNYPEAAKLGAGALPHLENLVGSMDPLLGSKAAYLAGLIDDARNASVLQKAARSQNAVVRLAAAATARNLASHAASDLLADLVHDGDRGVRGVALKSFPAAPTAVLRRKLEAMSQVEPDV